MTGVFQLLVLKIPPPPKKKNVFFASCFHDADDFFADDVSQHSSDIEHAEPDEQPSS